MAADATTFMGYRRPDGRVATRRHVVVASASPNVNGICEAVRGRCPDAVCVTHQSELRPDDELPVRTLTGFLDHPNVYAAIVVAMSDSDPGWQALSGATQKRGIRATLVTIADAGGLGPAVDRVVQLCRDALAGTVDRQAVPVAELILGTECGGSDANSGLTANPTLGRCADRIVDSGGSVILAEMTELIGAEHELARRAATSELRDNLVGAVDRWERFALQFGEDITGANPCHGNIVGGITTIEEKSLGCVRKSGTSPVVELVGFGEPPTRGGLVVMDTSGDDLEQLIAMTAGGANVIAFTTGRGTPIASPIVPTIKIASTTMLADRLADMIDFDAGTVLAGLESVDEAGDRLFELVLETAGGRLTSSERLGHQDFALPVTGAGA